MAKDPYRYFRVEARELFDGLTQGLLALEKGEHGKELLAKILRLAHTLKGAARVVKQARTSELTHAMEEVLAPYREGKQALPKERLAELFDLLDRIGAELAALGGGPPVSASTPAAATQDTQTSAAPARTPADDPFETVRVDVDELDRLLEGLSELGVRLAALRRSGEHLGEARLQADRMAVQLRQQAERAGGGEPAGLARAGQAAEELHALLGRTLTGLHGQWDWAKAELGQVRERAHQLRLIPAALAFGTLERAVRDAGHALQKTVVFETSGGETRLDAHVLASLQGALLQLVRNAVAHGIEPPAARKAAGKDPAGRVRVSATHRGNRVVFACEDDGAGIDVKAVRLAAAQAGLLDSARAQALGAEEVVPLLLAGGLTTSAVATEVSGRGIGLEVVRAAVAGLKGEITVRTEAGAGTVVEIRVPIDLVSLAALRVEAGGLPTALPLPAVRKTLRIEKGTVARSSERTELLCDGEALPFAPLAGLLDPGGTSSGPEPRTAVIVESDAGRVALGVDRLMGAATVIVRALPAFVQAGALVAGVSLDAEGQPELVLDAQGLVEAARAAGAARRAKAPAPQRPSILVIDDSLTTRMLEQSILEAEGYTVELATSAEEALVAAGRRNFGLFIVDVEMPGMNGFEFVEHVQASAALRQTPCILVTSRASKEDLKRGKDAGARAYIIKSEFDQGYLLQTIRNLVG